MGSGIKTFTSGSPLTASDVNGYLMRQAVVTCTSGARPASPTTGQPIFETDTGLIRVWNGTTWYCPASPDYISYNPTCYSNVTAGTAISSGSLSYDPSCAYQKVGKRVHFKGSVAVSVTTSNGFGIRLPYPLAQREFHLGNIWLGGTGYSSLYGRGVIANTVAPFERVTPVSYSNAFMNITTSGDICAWNILYESAS